MTAKKVMKTKIITVKRNKRGFVICPFNDNRYDTCNTMLPTNDRGEVGYYCEGIDDPNCPLIEYNIIVKLEH